MRRPSLCRFVVLVGLANLVVACGDDPPATTATADKPKAKAAAKSRKKAAEPEPTANPEEAPPKVEFQEEDFMETERSRDPFRSFEELFAQQAKREVRAQRTVLLADYSLDELKLIGIVSRITPAKAMLVTPAGQGQVIHRGDFVGRAERVQGAAPDADYDVNWRVDRIRDADVVMVREDPANPDVPTATRVIALHHEAKEKR